jgi:hypothetical protein
MKLGSRVCIAAKMLCFWQRNPLEIVYVNEGTSHTFNKLVSNGVEVTRSKGQGLHALFQFKSYTQLTCRVRRIWCDPGLGKVSRCPLPPLPPDKPDLTKLGAIENLRKEARTTTEKIRRHSPPTLRAPDF